MMYIKKFLSQGSTWKTARYFSGLRIVAVSISEKEKNTQPVVNSSTSKPYNSVKSL